MVRGSVSGCLARRGRRRWKCRPTEASWRQSSFSNARRSRSAPRADDVPREFRAARQKVPSRRSPPRRPSPPAPPRSLGPLSPRGVAMPPSSPPPLRRGGRGRGGSPGCGALRRRGGAHPLGPRRGGGGRSSSRASREAASEARVRAIRPARGRAPGRGPGRAAPRRLVVARGVQARPRPGPPHRHRLGRGRGPARRRGREPRRGRRRSSRMFGIRRADEDGRDLDPRRTRYTRRAAPLQASHHPVQSAAPRPLRSPRGTVSSNAGFAGALDARPASAPSPSGRARRRRGRSRARLHVGGRHARPARTRRAGLSLATPARWCRIGLR